MNDQRLLRNVAACALALLLCGVGGVVSASGAGSDVPRAAAAGARTTTVTGVVWNYDNSPVSGARVRLRNLRSGRIEAVAVADGGGRFVFAGLEGGAYAIEYVNDKGKLLALGNGFRVEAGETAATFVRLAAKSPWFAGFFSNAGAAAIAAASSVGVTALGSPSPAASPF